MREDKYRRGHVELMNTEGGTVLDLLGAGPIVLDFHINYTLAS